MALLKCINRPLRLFNCNTSMMHSLNNIRELSTQLEKDLLIDKLQDSQEGITIFSLNRPKVKNALSKTLVYSILKGIDSVQNDPSTRVLIIRSNVPGIFCAGADLKERTLMTEDEVKLFVKGLRGMMRNIENLQIPVIAALDGTAMGGGLEMALACDLRIATNTIKLGLVETRLAIIPGAGGTQRLPRIISPAIAKELIYTARVITGTEAKALGIVNHTVQQTETNDAAFKKALEIAEEILPNGPIALRMAKQAIDEGIQLPLSEGYNIEQKCYEVVVKSKDRLEGLKAFGEKRKPRYTGN